MFVFYGASTVQMTRTTAEAGKYQPSGKDCRHLPIVSNERMTLQYPNEIKIYALFSFDQAPGIRLLSVECRRAVEKYLSRLKLGYSIS